jgi:hypothetical protein
LEFIIENDNFFQLAFFFNSRYASFSKVEKESYLCQLTPGYLRSPHYYETDQMGIVHHSNYIRWFEEARVQLLNYLGCSYKEIEEAGIIIPCAGCFLYL